MNWVAGSSRNSWQPVMTADTTVSSYWLNWKVFVCSIWIILSMAAASLLIWKYECRIRNKPDREEVPEDLRGGLLYEDQCWRTCLKDIHPAWLLAFRVFAFVMLITLLIANVIVDGGDIFYFYTQWTFTLVTVYFGLGSLLSIYGCHHFFNKVEGDRVEHARCDAERGSYVAPVQGSSIVAHNAAKSSNNQEGYNIHHTAGLWSYIFQIIYQTCAGAVMLTDIVFWLIIFPFLTIRDYKLNFLLVGMHSVNVVLLLGDSALNCMLFPWFRVAYFILWTAIYVVFQWVIHACVPLWWPYPFFDLSSPYAPIWYLLVAVLHIPCYAIFSLIMKMKHHLLSKWFPTTYQCRR